MCALCMYIIRSLNFKVMFSLQQIATSGLVLLVAALLVFCIISGYLLLMKHLIKVIMGLSIFSNCSIDKMPTNNMYACFIFDPVYYTRSHYCELNFFFYNKQTVFFFLFYYKINQNIYCGPFVKTFLEGNWYDGQPGYRPTKNPLFLHVSRYPVGGLLRSAPLIRGSEREVPRVQHCIINLNCLIFATRTLFSNVGYS